ncbi:MAG: DUF2974 domain-containing protein [Acholeplasmatales bacterium]|nr:DUF2974 domain-containing protein [Acholeplasmatales bacterium]
MKNMLWYLKKYGNESFEKLEFNEIDALIFAELGYLNFELFSSDSNQEIFIKDVVNAKNAKKLSYGTTTRPKNEKLCALIEHTTRYDNVYFKAFRSIIDNETVEQFFGVTFFILDFCYIVFRGTDLTITGWEEDLNMAYMNEVPSQRDAVKYIMDISNLYNRKIMVGGHSKGGNLALYASIFAEIDVQDVIIKVYDFDGPGFLDKNILHTPEYFRIQNKVCAMSSTMSTVAMLLYNVENIEFLKTSGFTVLQHDPFNWHIASDTRFKRVKRNSLASRYFERTVDRFFDETTNEERKRYVEILVKIAKEKPDSSLLDVKKKPFRYFKKMRERKKLLDKDDSAFFKGFHKQIFRMFRFELKNSIKRKSTKSRKIVINS